METQSLSAHTPPDHDRDRWHDLEDHLRNTATLADAFGQAFGAGEISHAIALAHDLGKANPAFQRYLLASHEGNRAAKAPHADIGAAAVYDILHAFALTILGHHGGMPDRADAKRRVGAADREGVDAATDLAARLSFPPAPLQPPSWANNPTSAEMFIRMCFSTLVDADYLDTERHFSEHQTQHRGGYPTIDWYAKRLRSAMDALAEAARHTQSSVNTVRADVLTACRAAAPLGPGAFRLTVPTGGGKTLASLTFALEHAHCHAQRRVIVAIPYTSIIDQTAETYQSIFGQENVLEHHSAIETPEGEGQSHTELRRRLAAENWDCPLVVTTTVQLFESLFANRPARCRKLHNLARSVVILDEAQTLPIPLLGPIISALNELITHYGCTVLFCTATQPDFSGLSGAALLANAREIVDAPERHFASLRRVRYEWAPNPLSVAEVGSTIDRQQQVMCVLNTRRDALRVVKSCRSGDDLFHLSALMCPAHRRQTLAEVRARLDVGRPVRLVATQVVEAGVNLDFPMVMRALGPLDRIVQVAGRCNREGRMCDLGRCLIFDLDGGSGPPDGAYQTGIALSRTAVQENAERLEQPDVVARYFQDLYIYASGNGGKGAEIQTYREQFAYRTVAKLFRMIEDDTVPVLTLRYDPANVEAALGQWRHLSPRDFFRRLAPYTVSLRRRHFLKLEQEGVMRSHDSGAWLYDGAYSPLFGVDDHTVWDPADLIAGDKEET